MSSPTLDTLRADVRSRFEAKRPTPWPAPRPAMESPRDEEYSRCLDPGKYVILQQRAAAWAEALEAAGVAIRREVESRKLGPWGPVETTAVTPSRPGAQTVYLHFTSERLSGVVVAFGRPDVVLIALPDCGCDACDDGSEPLLDRLDEALDSVVMGEVLIERSRRGSRVLTMNGESGPWGKDVGPKGMTERWSGPAWLDG